MLYGGRVQSRESEFTVEKNQNGGCLCGAVQRMNWKDTLGNFLGGDYVMCLDRGSGDPGVFVTPPQSVYVISIHFTVCKSYNKSEKERKQILKEK